MSVQPYNNCLIAQACMPTLCIVRYFMSYIEISPKGVWERSGSVVECLTLDRGAAGLSLTGVTALWSLSKTHLS